ncbi:McrC family protein [Vibrio aestuarianus]|nr:MULTISPECIES: McrC family protein [Vibrio]MDE1311364.1 McrC family protein [Vibrio aestuarianus]
MPKQIALFEFAHLVSQESEVSRIPYWVEVISPLAFSYLKAMALSDDKPNRLFRLCRKNGAEALQVQNYAGVIATPDGTQVEILPKLVKVLNCEEESVQGSPDRQRSEQARHSLLVMLRALKGFSHIQTSSADIRQQKMPLLEVFISQFLASVNVLVKKGLRSDYLCQEDNLQFLKGKLNTTQQMRKNIINKHKFYCEYDEFLLDRPANRLLHSALNKLRSISRNAGNQKQLQELCFVLDEVPLSTNYKSDFTQLRLDRGMSHYQTPLAWAKLILEGFSPQTMRGDHRAISLLFPMEKVFEDYVAKVLAKQLKPELSLKTQAQSKHLVTHNDSAWFKLKPDLLIEKAGEVISVLDTKWKLIDPTKANGTDKYGLSQSDFYQMFAYGNHYFDQAVTKRYMFLIYPAHAGFKQAIEHSFDFSTQAGNPLTLWVVPFVIGEGEGCGVQWPKLINPQWDRTE